ncbi:hypothetical protein CK203_099634 [Vitis vinifera]|uniref:Uncharacterized protein n=1 Tax=Vitis vinifera TaxID=29760 RepID=A0A438DNE8_VITVI|nr:hypothetical protein CK203_099634 [Vitis vinifera]
MAGVSRKISAASARSHTRKSHHNTSKLPSGLSLSLSLSLSLFLSPVFILEMLHLVAEKLEAARPPPPKICGSPGGPAITAHRIKLRDGRHLAYKEHVYDSGRLAGATLIAPVINYWWPGFPANLSKEAYYHQFPQDQWALRVAHYTPWLTYWWNTQKLFPASSVIGGRPQLSRKDMEIIQQMAARPRHLMLQASQQGEFESIHRDLMIGFGSWSLILWSFENPFPNNEGSVHIGKVMKMASCLLCCNGILQGKLSWIHYHEVPVLGTCFLLQMA